MGLDKCVSDVDNELGPRVCHFGDDHYTTDQGWIKFGGENKKIGTYEITVEWKIDLTGDCKMTETKFIDKINGVRKALPEFYDGFMKGSHFNADVRICSEIREVECRHDGTSKERRKFSKD